MRIGIFADSRNPFDSLAASLRNLETMGVSGSAS
jgi:hypothetical protein